MNSSLEIVNRSFNVAFTPSQNTPYSNTLLHVKSYFGASYIYKAFVLVMERGGGNMIGHLGEIITCNAVVLS